MRVLTVMAAGGEAEAEAAGSAAAVVAMQIVRSGGELETRRLVRSFLRDDS